MCEEQAITITEKEYDLFLDLRDKAFLLSQDKRSLNHLMDIIDDVCDAVQTYDEWKAKQK